MSLATNLTNLATRIATELKAHKTLINGNAADLSALTTTAKTSLVAAINEVKAGISGAAGISDGTTGTSSTWSSQKITDQLAALKSSILGSASAAYDTLGELMALMQADDTQTTGILTALAARVRTDTAAQGLDATAKANARTNIDAASATDVGDTTTNFVTVFEAGLV